MHVVEVSRAMCTDIILPVDALSIVAHVDLFLFLRPAQR
jgi:hypothetical protein